MLIPPKQAADVDGIPIAWSVMGKGRPLVLIHGALTGLEDSLIALAPTLSRTNRLIAFDRPGHGGSGRGPTTGSLWRQAQLIRGAIEQMGVERPILIGHSFGGAVAMAYALQFPDEVAGVVGVGPIAFPEFRLEQILFSPRATPVLGDMLSYASMGMDALAMPILWRAMFMPQQMPEAFAAAFPVDSAGERSRMRSVAEEASWMPSDLGRMAMAYSGCRVPVRILTGTADLVVNPMMHGRRLADVVPDGGRVQLEGVGHMLHHFRPDVVAEAVAEIEALTSSRKAKAAA